MARSAVINRFSAVSRRGLLAAVAFAVISLTLMAASTLLTVAFTDYEEEALPSITALDQHDWSGFLGGLPAYGGSLIIRAPAALLAHALGGGDLAVYRALAAPCLLAGVIFGLVLWLHLAGRRATAAAWIALVVVVANPVILPALDTGHPEEYLGAVLCAGGVLAALRGHAVWAGVLIGAAGANKAWAVLAVVPALMALPTGRIRFLAVAGGVCGAIMAPALLGGSAAVGNAQTVAHQAGAIFQPWQWSWFFGFHGGVVHGLYGDKPGYRTGPGWLDVVGHLPVIVVPLVTSLAVWARGSARARDSALLVLALCFLLRCVVDPWDTAYYHLPFLMALAAHESLMRNRAPLLTWIATAAIYGSTVMARSHVSPDAQAALYLAWSLPAVAMIVLALAAPRRAAALGSRALSGLRRSLPSLARVVAPSASAAAQSTTVSSLVSPLSTSCPSSVTMTRSSIRTPTAPGT